MATMPKLTMQSTLSVVSLGTPANPEQNTASRVCIEEVSPARWMAHAVISPVDIGAFKTEADAARALVEALDRLAMRTAEAYVGLEGARADSGDGPVTMPDTPIASVAAILDTPSAALPDVATGTTIASAHTATGPTVPTEVRPVVIEDTGHAPVAPVAVGPLGHPIG